MAALVFTKWNLLQINSFFFVFGPKLKPFFRFILPPISIIYMNIANNSPNNNSIEITSF